MTFVLGLTGSIATGKSTVSHYFLNHDIPVVDSDLIAREVVEPGTIGLHNIVNYFGKEILFEDGSLNRKKLGNLVFANPEKLKKLNQLLATELDQAISKKIEEYTSQEVPLVVVDVPLMYESNYDKKMDAVMVVYIPETLQMKRLMARDGIDEKEAQQKIASQWSIEKKKELATVVIDNSHTIEETEASVGKWLKKTLK